ncbi:MAG: hypothetical protein IPG97_12695 [Microthrixaceae bacterium]|jgi:uncharacterized protein (TIGR02611 family)|nr:hypothetical protein [Microthrixaceae bacterium]
MATILTGAFARFEPYRHATGLDVGHNGRVTEEHQPAAHSGAQPPQSPIEEPYGVRAELAERLEVLRDAAIEAEYATGKREATEELAKRHVLIRLATIVVGFVVLTGGLAMLVLPGPGVVGVVAGLGILARELPWAARMVEYVKRKARYEDIQAQPMWLQASLGLLALTTMAGSLVYFTVIR